MSGHVMANWDTMTNGISHTNYIIEEYTECREQISLRAGIIFAEIINAGESV